MQMKKHKFNADIDEDDDEPEDFVPVNDRTFLVTEIGFVLHDSILAINKWINERQNDEVWRRKFLASSSELLSRKYR